MLSNASPDSHRTRPEEQGTVAFALAWPGWSRGAKSAPRPGVDEVWPGTGVIYSQRLSADRTRSRLSNIVGTPAYKSMTIRSWATTLALLERMEAPEAEA
jgi:hypothetical protein